jgi:iron complex outermembrane receptor protein
LTTSWRHAPPRRFDDREGPLRQSLYTGEKSNAIKRRRFPRPVARSSRPTAWKALLSVHYRDYETDGSYWTTASYAASGIVRNGYAPSTDKDEISTNAANSAAPRSSAARCTSTGMSVRLSLTSITGYERFKTRGAGDGDYTPLEISRSYTAARAASNGRRSCAWLISRRPTA